MPDPMCPNQPSITGSSVRWMSRAIRHGARGLEVQAGEVRTPPALRTQRGQRRLLVRVERAQAELPQPVWFLALPAQLSRDLAGECGGSCGS